MKVLVLGAGFGGLELTTRLSEELGDEVEVVLIDRSEHFVFGFSKLDVMFGKSTAEHVRHPYSALVKAGVTFVQANITEIDPSARRVVTDAGTFTGDVMVVALGADLDPAATPGLVEAGHEFYTVSGAFAARDVLAGFEGGDVVIGVTSKVFKCPPAPSETTLLVHDLLVERGLRDRSTVSLVMPMGSPVPPSPATSDALLEAFAERGITWVPNAVVERLDPERNVVHFVDGREMPFDLFLGVPEHRVPDVVADSGLCVDGWIPVDSLTLETTTPDVYAIGDVTSVGTPKAGAFAEGQGEVVAAAIIARVRRGGEVPTYDGTGRCYIEYGDRQVGAIDVTFLAGQAPTGNFTNPSADLAARKEESGEIRVKRWFGRDWSMH